MLISIFEETRFSEDEFLFALLASNEFRKTIQNKLVKS